MPLEKIKKYKHHMIKEIHEQVGILDVLLKRYLDFKQGRVKKFSGLGKISKRIKRFTFIGNGSSSYAALLGNYLFEELVGLPCEYEQADEFIIRKKVIEPNTAIIALSQSGETADVIKAISQARESKAFVIAITNTPNSRITDIADHTILTEAGKEMAVAATKTFLTQIIMVFLLAIYFAQERKQKISAKVFTELELLPEKVAKTLETEKQIELIVKKILKSENIIVLGRKYNYPIALEGAQKLKETAYVHAEGLAAEEFRHGPEAIINSKYSAIILAPVDSNFAKIIQLSRQIKKHGGQVVLVTNKTVKEFSQLSDKIITIPETLEILNPFLLVLPLQLLSYYLAVKKKINVNHPRYLKKYIA